MDKFLLEDSELENKIINCKIKNEKKKYLYGTFDLLPIIDNFYLKDIDLNCSIKVSDNNLKNYRVNDVNKFISLFKKKNINKNTKKKEDFFEKFQNHKGYLLFIIFFKDKLKPLHILIPNIIEKFKNIE